MSNSTDSSSTTTSSDSTTDSTTSDSISVTTVTSTDTPTTSAVITTETSTVTSGSTTFVTTTESTSISTITSSISAPTSTTTVPPPSTTTTPPSSVVEVTSYLTVTHSSDGAVSPSVVTLTSTVPQFTSTRSESASASSSQPSALTASGADGSSASSSGLSSGGKIAVAVVIPLVAIALAFIFGLCFYKKRQKRKSEQAMRQKEMAEYGFNPNNDPSLVPVGAVYADNGSESAEENSGYRGWGNTSTTQRKPSTTMGSGSRGPAGMAMSESSSNQGGHGHPGSDHYSGDTVTGAAAAAAGMAATRRTDINRGPSNASSAYSAGHGALSELSDDGPTAVPGPYYHEEVPYNIYNELPVPGPYGDGGRPAGPPVIQNVGARRDTRIERVPTFPPQQVGNAGIAQNF